MGSKTPKGRSFAAPRKKCLLATNESARLKRRSPQPPSPTIGPPPPPAAASTHSSPRATSDRGIETSPRSNPQRTVPGLTRLILLNLARKSSIAPWKDVSASADEISQKAFLARAHNAASQGRLSMIVSAGRADRISRQSPGRSRTSTSSNLHRGLYVRPAARSVSLTAHTA